jgi:hypothetical protein
MWLGRLECAVMAALFGRTTFADASVRAPIERRRARKSDTIDPARRIAKAVKRLVAALCRLLLVKTETRSFYEAAVERTVRRISRMLDEALNLDSLARELRFRRSTSTAFFAECSGRRPSRCTGACASSEPLRSFSAAIPPSRGSLSRLDMKRTKHSRARSDKRTECPLRRSEKAREIQKAVRGLRKPTSPRDPASTSEPR